MLWRILVQFLLRMSFGLATCMAITSHRQVDSGFYRVHLWVLLGLNTFVSAVAYVVQADLPHGKMIAVASAVAAAIAYVGACAWLYEKKHFGLVTLVICAFINLFLAWYLVAPDGLSNGISAFADVATSGVTIGS